MGNKCKPLLFSLGERSGPTPYLEQASGCLQRFAKKLRPNPSIERTSTGLARSASLVHVPLRGPSRWRPAHVKR
jgi:hypothetical protein